MEHQPGLGTGFRPALAAALDLGGAGDRRVRGRALPAGARSDPPAIRLARAPEALPVDETTITFDATDETNLTEDSDTPGEVGENFRFDPEDQQYIYKLKTRGYDYPATYRIYTYLDDGTEHTVDFSIRAK